MLNETSACLNILLIFLFSFPVGYVLLRWAKVKQLLNVPFFVGLPIYLTLGLLVSSLSFFAIGLLRVSGYLFLISLLPAVLILFSIIKSKNKKAFAANLLSYENIIPAILFIFTLSYFSIVIGIFKWPPVGDVYNHGLFTSVIVYNQRVGFTLTPFASLPIFPTLTGLHVLSAVLSMFTGLLPGEAVFIVGGAIVVLIPTLIYSLLQILTHSKLLSIFAFLSVFLIGPGNMEQWIFGYFYNGPYPNMFGFLAILLFITYSVASGKELEEKSSIGKKILTLVIILGVAIVYPPFVVFPFIYLVLSRLSKREKIKSFWVFITRWKNVLLFSVIFAVLIVLIAVSISTKQLLFPLIEGLSLYGSRIYETTAYAVGTSIFYNSPIGVAILVAGIIALFFAIKGINSKLALFYLSVFVPVMLSLHPSLLPFFSFILPSRSLMICGLISWVLIAVFLNYLFINSQQVPIEFKIKKKISFPKIKLNRSKVAVTILIASLVFTPSLFSTLTFEQANKFNWLMPIGFENDFDVLLWIHENVKPDELIVNDYSYTSTYLLSFSLKNVTSKYHFNSEYEENRALEIQNIWRNPEDVAGFRSLVAKYNASYLLVTSEWGYRNWVGIGGNSKYIEKPYTPAEYKAIFNENPLLELVFEKGNAAVYKIATLGEVVSQSALNFEKGDYIRVEHDESIMPSTEFTVAFWVNPKESPTDDQYIISKRADKDGYEILWRWDKRVNMRINGTLVLQSNKTFTSNALDKWWYIACVYDGENASIYINGELDASAALSGSIAPNTAPLSIGCRRPDNPYLFAPSQVLDEIRIYNRALSLNEIGQIYKSDEAVLDSTLCLRFAEGEGNLIYDQSIYGNTGTIYGAEWINYDVLLINSSFYRILD